MPFDAEGADSGDAPEEEAEDVSQVGKDQRVPPPLSAIFTMARPAFPALS